MLALSLVLSTSNVCATAVEKTSRIKYSGECTLVLNGAISKIAVLRL